MTIQDQMHQAVSAWVASGGREAEEQAVLQLLEDPDHKALGYVERNREFVTSSKLKEFQACAFHAKLRYIDAVDMGFDDHDYFTIGSAVDLRLTSGEEAYQSRYAAVKIRNDKAIAENPGKVLLTNAQAQTIDQAVKEFRSREFFPKIPTKKNVIWLMGKTPCKAELDHVDPETRRIGDIKTTASILTFDPHFYDLQMSFYAFGIEKRFGEKVEAELYVTDKHSNYSRSHKWVFTRSTLSSHFYEVEDLVRQWQDALETGIWAHCDVSTDEGLRTAWSSEFWSICPFCRTSAPSIL